MSILHSSEQDDPMNLKIFALQILKTTAFLSAFTQLYLDQDIILVIKVLIISSLGDWLGKNLQYRLNVPQHDQILTFFIAIAFEHLILKYLTTLLIKLNLLDDKHDNESPTDSQKLEIPLILEDDSEESSFSLASRTDSESQPSQLNKKEIDQELTFGVRSQKKKKSAPSLIQQSSLNLLAKRYMPKRTSQSQELIIFTDSLHHQKIDEKQELDECSSSKLLKKLREESLQSQPVCRECDQLNQVRVLQLKIKELEAKIEANKVFTYMVIHDLKHPTESVLSQLEVFKIKLQQAIQEQNSLINLVENQKAADLKNFNLIRVKFDSFINEIQVGLKDVEKETKNLDSQSKQNNSDSLAFPNRDQSFQQCESPQIRRENFILKKSNFSSQQDLDVNSDSSIDCEIQEGSMLMPYIQINTKQKKQVNQVQKEEPQFSSLTHKRLWNSLSNVILHRGEDAHRFQIEISDKKQVLVKQFSDSNLIKNKEHNRSVSNRKFQSIIQGLFEKCTENNNSLTACIEKLSNQQFRNGQELKTLMLQNITNLEELERFVNMMLFSTKMMQNLMMDLLDFAQIEKNTFKLNKEFFNLFDVIKQVFQMVSHVAEKKKVQLVPPNTSKEDEQYFMLLYGDKNRFVQVIINFLSNSLKFSAQGSKIILHLEMLQNQRLVNQDFLRHKSINDSLKFSINASLSNENKIRRNSCDLHEALNANGYENSVFFASESSVRRKQTNYINFMLTIQDFGCGIPNDKLKHLFFNFSNLQEHQKVNPTGRGLGLSICKQIVEQMGGDVKVQSQVGVGSKFSMTFKTFCNLEISSESSHEKQPFEDISPEQQQFIQLQAEIGSQFQLNEKIEIMKTDSLKPRVLIANDEIYLLCGYEFQLQSFFEVETAENGMQALQMVTSNPVDYFDLIILDINMPIMDGIESCQLIYKYLHSNEIQNSPLESLLQQKSELTKIQHFTPLIYALTGECSPESVQRIMKQQFEKVLNRISADNMQMFLKQIKDKRSLFAIPDIKKMQAFEIIKKEESHNN